jgi:2-polyprenyl-3-methyl-5-hydroxy-6-metoxy-1,4-benzoquinol methylase
VILIGQKEAIAMIDQTIEESKEKSRHECKYSEESDRELILKPIDWDKFDHIKLDINSYSYAVRSLDDIKAKKILDLGCGTGWFSVILAKRGAIVDGIDISETAIDIAKRRAIVNGVELATNFQPMSFYDLEYPDGHFDAIIGLAALHHARDKDRLRDSLFRVLKPGGRIIFNEPFGNCEFLERLRLLVPVKVNEEDRTHWNEQLKYKDLDVFDGYFNVRVKEFQFLSRIDRIIDHQKLTEIVGRFDRFLLDRIVAMRAYARTIVVILDKASI